LFFFDNNGLLKLNVLLIRTVCSQLCTLQGRVILLDSDEMPLIVTDTVSFADLLKTTLASLPASQAHESNIIRALASCRLICNIRDVTSNEVQNVYVACLPTEPTVKWVCMLYMLYLLKS